ncbi:hypothetical protein MMC18_009185 [Xylographa bjoerkii]|nr:hypothetical protein [Xylographa bjoerkii]
MPTKRSKQSILPSQKRPPVPMELHRPLPDCDGPKLNVFEHHKEAVQFVELLSAETPGEDGHVFEVVIRSKRYALKMFNFYEPPDDLDDLDQLGLSREAYISELDPFYAECRAYGCIEKNQLNGQVAVQCHGYMAVSAERETELMALPFDIDEWNRPAEEYELPEAKRQPFRAIVKKLVRSRKRLCRVAQMRDDLLALHKIGVYVRDIREDNYVLGKLVDFSLAWTAPHSLLDPNIRSPQLINAEIEGELLDFDRMLQEAGIRTRLKAFSEPHQVGRLRSTVKKPDRFGF